jgi:hypothetical protein
MPARSPLPVTAFTLISRLPRRPCASYLAALPSRAIETRSLSALVRCYLAALPSMSLIPQLHSRSRRVLCRCSHSAPFTDVTNAEDLISTTNPAGAGRIYTNAPIGADRENRGWMVNNERHDILSACRNRSMHGSTTHWIARCIERSIAKGFRREGVWQVANGSMPGASFRLRRCWLRVIPNQPLIAPTTLCSMPDAFDPRRLRD